MYHVAGYFEVRPGHAEDFVAAALEDGRNSIADEPGTLRFEVIVDKNNPNRFYLIEAYADADAFCTHARGPHFGRFFELIEDYVERQDRLITGTQVEDR